MDDFYLETSLVFKLWSWVFVGASSGPSMFTQAEEREHSEFLICKHLAESQRWAPQKDDPVKKRPIFQNFVCFGHLAL